jgi:hypothetical protein
VPLAIQMFAEYLLHRRAHSSLASFRVALYSLLNQAKHRVHIRSRRGMPATSSFAGRQGVPITLLSVFAASLAALAPPTRLSLLALGKLPTWPATFSEERALQIAGCSPGGLDALCDSGLLAQASEGEYALNPLVADCALVAEDAPHRTPGEVPATADLVLAAGAGATTGRAPKRVPGAIGAGV